MSAFSEGSSERWPAIVIGAGAAGMLCAIFAARRGVKVLLLESRPKPGAKIRVSGGGRCNVLPSRVELEDYVTQGSRAAMRNVLFSWPLPQVIRFFEDELGVALKIESTGKMFPKSDSSKEVVDALLAECARSGVVLRGECRVSQLKRSESNENGSFAIRGESGETWLAERVVIATGGLSLPKTGSDGAGYALARGFGHTIRPTYPALVALRSDELMSSALAGLSLPVAARVAIDHRIRESRSGDFLFTHGGFSGPVILDLSHWFTRPQEGGDAQLMVKWGGVSAPDWETLLRQGGSQRAGAIARDALPRRLADHLLQRASVSPERKLSELTREERARWVACFESFSLSVRGSEGYAKAEVTGGGLPLEEVHLATLESRTQRGLYFVGEIFDVTGRLGGYNFLWAWVTGRKAGLALATTPG
jgi:predicted Rossmann fold flavoprotein